MEAKVPANLRQGVWCRRIQTTGVLVLRVLGVGLMDRVQWIPGAGCGTAGSDGVLHMCCKYIQVLLSLCSLCSSWCLSLSSLSLLSFTWDLTVLSRWFSVGFHMVSCCQDRCHVTHDSHSPLRRVLPSLGKHSETSVGVMEAKKYLMDARSRAVS